MKNSCLLCGGEKVYIYTFAGYALVQCLKCKTVCVEKFPDNETLVNYYKGFKYCINENNKKLILNNSIKQWYESFDLPANARMLDIGGGNGYFSLAFEKYGFGKATYIDLDSEACKYVESLGISNVINDDVKSLTTNITEKFNFIYCRHVIEHLVNPIDLIEDAIKLLSDDGVFVLQTPNGLSFEYLIEPIKFQNKFCQIKKENNFSNIKTLKMLYSNKTAFDIAPPRHLWAFSSKGLNYFLKTKKDIQYKLYTASSRNKVFSPYLYDFSKKFSKYLIKLLLIPFKKLLRSIYQMPNGKSHIVIEIRKSKKERI